MSQRPAGIRPANRPALSAIAYRVGRHPDFVARMHASIATEAVVDETTATSSRPLAGLSTRSGDDPSLALMDAWASVLDVLTFYQERIANEGYLRTATERVSAAELVRMIGHELDPGVAASAHLAFVVEDADEPFRAVDVPTRTQVMSVPEESGELPQTFETVESIEARAEWNAIPVRTQRPQNLAIFQHTDNEEDPRNGRLFLLDVDNSFEVPDPSVDDSIDPDDVVTIDLTASEGREPCAHFVPVTDGLDIEATILRLREDAALSPQIEPFVRGVAVDYVHLRGVGHALTAGDRLLLVGTRAVEAEQSVVKVVPVQVLRAVEDLAYGMTRVDVAAVVEGAPPPRRDVPFVARPARLPIGEVSAVPQVFSATTVNRLVLGQTWSDAALSAFVKTQAWPREQLMTLLRQESLVPTSSVGVVTPGVYALRQSVGFFGNSAPRWSSLADPEEQRGEDPYEEPWDQETGETGRLPRAIFEDSQGAPLEDAHVLLEREVDEVAPGGLTLFETAVGRTRCFLVARVATSSITDFAQSGKATGLTLRNPDDTDFDPFESGSLAVDLESFTFRKTTAWLGSELLPLAGLPLLEDVARNAGEITLDNLYLDLAPGRAVSIAGERADAAGINESETLILDDVIHTGGFTRLTFASPTEFSYKRPTVTVNANVARAAHGETIEETLGDGDATRPNQAFALAKPPLTFVSAATETGSTTTLTVRVNGIEWTEVPSLYDAGPEDAVYAVRIDDAGTTRVVFGDGEHGRRLPTGAGNVWASYRSGMGPAGEVSDDTLIQLKKRPLGVRSVTNPSAASGSASAETLDEARERGPQSVRTLGRLVSLPDYEDFARAFAGIGKARASILHDRARAIVHVTVAPSTEGTFPASAPTLSNLQSAMEALRDPFYSLVISPHQTRLFRLSASVAYDQRHLAGTVEAAIRRELDVRFGYGARQLAQPVSAAEIVAAMQGVAGVVHVDLDVLALFSSDSDVSAGPSLASVLVAANASHERSSNGSLRYSGDELLTILPSGIDLAMEEAADA